MVARLGLVAGRLAKTSATNFFVPVMPRHLMSGAVSGPRSSAGFLSYFQTPPIQSKAIYASTASSKANIGGYTIDLANLTGDLVTPKDQAAGGELKIHVNSFPSTADSSLLAQPGTEWGQVISLMPQARKGIDRLISEWKSNTTIVTPTKENIEEFRSVLATKGIEGAKKLGWYPEHQEKPMNGHHSFLEEAIQREVTLQLLIATGKYDRVIRVDAPVSEFNFDGEFTTKDGKTYSLGGPVGSVIDFSSELKTGVAFGNVPTKDMNALVALSPEKYANEPLVLVGGGQSTSWAISRFLLNNENPVKQIVIGLRAVPGSKSPDDFLRELQAETDPKKKLNMLFDGQVIDKNLDDLLEQGIMEAIEGNRIVFFDQSNAGLCQVSQADGLTTYSGTNLATGAVIPPTLTQLPVISAIGVYHESQIQYTDSPADEAVLRAAPHNQWHAPANVPQGSAVSNFHKVLKALGAGAPHEDLLGMPLNRFTEACKSCYQEMFAARDLEVPDAFFSDLATALKDIKTDTIQEAPKFNRVLDELLSKHLPGKEGEFKQIYADVCFNRAEKIHEGLNEIWERVVKSSPDVQRMFGLREARAILDRPTQPPTTSVDFADISAPSRLSEASLSRL